MGSSNTGGGGGSAEKGEAAKAESPPEAEETHNVAADAAAAAAAPDPPTCNPAFVEGEKILAYHGPRIYEAKVQKVEYRENQWKYFVHYLGWSKNWDEWIENARLLKFNEENVEKQKILKNNPGPEKNPKSSRSGQNKPKGSNEAKMEKEDPKNNLTRGKKRKGHTGVEDDTKPSEKMIQLPLTLKKQLVDDWEFVSQLGKLVKLPRNPNVDDILKKYLEYRTKKDGMIADSVGEILKGIRCYFDKALLAMLLYKNERQQYRDAVGDKVSPSSVYGAEHLLRLFVKLPELLAYVNMEEDALTKLQQKLSDFLKFLQKNQSSFFLSTYDGSRSE
uniref:Mortality factor 4-like protein 1 n=1 Tax=Anthurium amnicola TaxID=1678845 RepID=A0A1D1YA12_9ARAE